MRAAVVSLGVTSSLLVALALAIQTGTVQDLPRLAALQLAVREAPQRPPDEAVQAYRLDQAEKAITSIRHEHQALTYLLVGNLVAVLASLVTYLLTARRRPPS